MPGRKKRQENAPLSVVGIGASAGGIEALQKLFKALPADLGHAYVVVVHLAPDHASDLSDILGRCTKMPVAQVDDARNLEPDHVYVIPPNRNLEITDTAVNARKFPKRLGERTTIDVFLRSLAMKHGDGFAVVLSGGGSDGALGARAVKEAGGVILVQEPAEATHGSMPEAVIAAGVADVVAPVEELASALADISQRRHQLLPILRPAADRVQLDEEEEKNLKKIIEYLRARTGHDFAQYKRATILRRLGRRMQLARTATFGEYLSHLKATPDEIARLQDDLLITVTSFFRDPDAWEALRKLVIEPLIRQTDRDATIRAWVVGCATGEEAYSLAMEFHEAMGRLNERRDLIIFASDIDEESLATARKGRYPTAIEVDVSPERLERFFSRHGNHYHVAEGIRNGIIFAQHSAFRDPPFSAIHLLSCRNFLIYLERDMQEQVQEIFRHALRDDGYLFIGSAEAALPGLFEPIDKHHRIYGMGPRPAEFPFLSPTASGHFGLLARAIGHRRPNPALHSLELAKSHLELIEKSAPPSMLVDRDGRVLHLSPTAGRYSQPRGGEPEKTLDALLRVELRDEARATLDRALAARAPAVSPVLRVRFNGAARRVTMLVHPRPDTDGENAVALVMFLESEEVPADAAPEGSGGKSQLVMELRERLRNAGVRIEKRDAEHEMTLQDLRAANEELQSLNEEYRSTAEELETSKEELQSVNEELQTVNTELSFKLDEASRARSDLENLLAATNIPTLFLDRDLCIKRFTPPLSEVFNIRTSDEGRPIKDLRHNIESGDLAGSARQVLAKLAPVEYEATTGTGRTLMVRLFPYRSADDRIDGVVITFVDITKAKESEDQLRQSRSRLEAELHVTQRLHQMWMMVTTATSHQAALDEILGTAVDLLDADFGTIEILDADAKKMRIVAHHGIRKGFLAGLERLLALEGSATRRAMAKRRQERIDDVSEDEAYAPHRDFAARLGYRAAQASPLVDPDGEIMGVMSTMYRQPRAITSRHGELAELLASQASILISVHSQQRRLAQLVDQLKERAALIEASDRQLRAQAEELLAQDRAKEDFLNMLGHELRNPLAAIRNSLEALDREVGTDLADGGSFRERALRIIDRQSRHMTRMVNDLLEISRINRGKLNLRLQSLDLRNIVSDAVETLEHDFRKKALALRVDMPEDPVYVRADPERAAQVVDNILRNAYQFTEPGGRITIDLAREDTHACISIIDDGMGMDPEQIETLFEPYRQAGADGSGLGLGLSLCRKLMELHAGEITAYSDGAGKGSKFVLSFPLSKSRPVAVPASQEPLNRLRVLVVDDDTDNAASLAVLLDSLGQETRIANDGEAALEVARDFEPHLVFLDISMPGMNGFEVAHKMRGDDFAGRRMTLVGLSGHPKKEDSTEFDGYILKPATLDDIFEVLNTTPTA